MLNTNSLCLASLFHITLKDIDGSSAVQALIIARRYCHKYKIFPLPPFAAEKLNERIFIHDSNSNIFCLTNMQITWADLHSIKITRGNMT